MRISRISIQKNQMDTDNDNMKKITTETRRRTRLLRKSEAVPVLDLSATAISYWGTTTSAFTTSPWMNISVHIRFTGETLILEEEEHNYTENKITS